MPLIIVMVNLDTCCLVDLTKKPQLGFKYTITIYFNSNLYYYLFWFIVCYYKVKNKIWKTAMERFNIFYLPNR